MRVSAPLLDAVKKAAAARGMSYQRFIRQAIEQAVQIVVWCAVETAAFR